MVGASGPRGRPPRRRGTARGTGPFLAAALILAVISAPARGTELSGENRFSGETLVQTGETWRVLPGAILRFREGRLIVRGRLLVEGTADRPVRILGEDTFEGLDIRGGGKAVLTHAVIAGGTIGAQVIGTEARFESVRWEKNGIGLVVSQHAAVNVSDSSFVSPLRVGVLVKRGGSARIDRTSFRGAGKTGLYVFGADNVAVRKSRFERNETGIIAAMLGARPVVEQCILEGNGTGLLAEKMAEPEVRESEFAENRVGLHFLRRAGGTVSGSRIVRNEDGAVVEFSSYPVFRGNRFGENRDKAVRLRNQSSEWEEELGETDRESSGGFAPFGSPPAGRSDFRPGGGTSPPGSPPGKKAGLDGTVDFRGNHWGEDAETAARGGNLGSIHDGRDEPDFPYKGKLYRMDRVLLR